MNLFGVLGNTRGQRSLASRVFPRRPAKRLPAERLAAARLLNVLNLLDDAAVQEVPLQLDGADPQHESAAREPRHARELATAPSGTDPVSSANRVSVPEIFAPEVVEPEVLAPEVVEPEVLAPEAVEPEVLAPEVPAAGRHRRTGVHPAVSADEIPAAAIQGAGRHRRPGLPAAVNAAVDCADPSKAPGFSTSVVPGAGHHRRPGVRAALALRALRVPSHQLMLLGVLVLLVAVAVALGVRGSGGLESAQPHADAATSQSAEVTVPATR